MAIDLKSVLETTLALQRKEMGYAEQEIRQGRKLENVPKNWKHLSEKVGQVKKIVSEDVNTIIDVAIHVSKFINCISKVVFENK